MIDAITMNTAMTKSEVSVLPPHIPQYWNDTTAHPWRRFGARFFDMMLSKLLSLVVVFAVILALPVDVSRSFILLVGSQPTPVQLIIIGSVLTTIISVLINAVQIGLVGSSIGKWFFGVKVLNSEHKPMGFKLAFKRELMVLYRGLGFNIPIILAITKLISYVKLRQNGITSWDRDLHCIVLHKSMGFLQVLLYIVGFIIVSIGFYLRGGNNINIGLLMA